MSSRSDELQAMADRGDRVKQVREALDLTGVQFADRVEKLVAGFGAAIRFDDTKLSRVEGGTRNLTAEEAAAVAWLDPAERSVQWLVFGRERPARGAKPVDPSIVSPSPSGRDAKGRQVK